MTEEQKASIQYAAEWLFRSEDISNRKHAERLRALLAAGASEGQAETIYQVRFRRPLQKWMDMPKHDWDLRNDDAIYERRIVYAHPSAEIAALRERIAKRDVDIAENDALIDSLRERIAKYQAVCAAAYQFVGAVDGPVRFLDALSNAANGEPASVDASLALLPAEPSERIAGMEKDAERYRWLRDNGDLSVRDVFGSWCEQLNDGLDAAIDAAIAKEKGDD